MFFDNHAKAEDDIYTPDISHWCQWVIEHAPLLLSKIKANTTANSSEEALAGLAETLKFLHLCSNSQSSLTPSVKVDQVWHEFILFTRTYEQFCRYQFNQFIHHQPSASPTLEKNQYQNTLELYQQWFGQPDQTYWPVPNDDISHCGLCESD
ncbi:hypothetical protein EYS14_04205 [Alteromonadaceae bacterium M269]|nr:hypothetical protein EYS14_04205 [Alteromonadaceae bacterium M269]